jgi:hypothetical protein
MVHKKHTTCTVDPPYYPTKNWRVVHVGITDVMGLRSHVRTVDDAYRTAFFMINVST